MRFLVTIISTVLIFTIIQVINPWTADSVPTPVPIPWPHQFHALLSTTMDDESLLISHYWYDWPNRRAFYIRQKQLGVREIELEWNNGTSYFYIVGGEEEEGCKVIDFGVGIPRPDFLLDQSHYLGTQLKDGFLCNVWEKADFIWYAEDVHTKRPVAWDFSDGITTHVITFDVGATLPESAYQAPAYCFTAQKDV